MFPNTSSEDDTSLGAISDRIRFPAEAECRIILTIILRAARDAKFSSEARDFFHSEAFRWYLELLPIENSKVFDYLREKFPLLDLQNFD